LAPADLPPAATSSTEDALGQTLGQTPNRASNRALGLDPGARWIGVAITDDDRRLALPLLTIDRRAILDDGAAQIRERLGPEGAAVVVVGVPLRPDGAEDDQARTFQALGAKIAAALELPCEFISERFSNPLGSPASLPKSDQKRGGRRGSQRKGKTSVAKHKQRRTEEHALAAANILQRWLDTRGSAPDEMEG
jgi:putative Holliday junction resolvase